MIIKNFKILTKTCQKTEKITQYALIFLFFIKFLFYINKNHIDKTMWLFFNILIIDFWYRSPKF